ncbi:MULTISPECIES: ABC transporter ATP-binding protein [Stenotrophomonas]|uniref:ABC transporter ATP-binding protein n=1 Tax=Stenotrophomonas TaxID=40323 RepID=UPI000D53F130|nr:MULTISPECIES: ABC transporter ATP-binding protein [Stenotrophomonas]AWH33226.1 ABC transporter ATP-binding protein [Stenotrophomonas sp. SAU14A_NAIMI4_8]
MLVLRDVSKLYRTGGVETTALRAFNLHVHAGDFISVTGPSGSGKSTLLNIMGLLELPSTGEYLIDGVPSQRLSDRERSHLRSEKFGFVFQGFNLLPDLSVFDNCDMPLRYRPMSARERRTRIEDALERVGLASRMRHLPSQLSGGQQQRVAIARALAGSPRVLLADEPTGNLDSQMSEEIMAMLEGINQAGTAVLLITHDRALAARADRNIRILDGIASEIRAGDAADIALAPSELA